jgi:hypothetical protein
MNACIPLGGSAADLRECLGLVEMVLVLEAMVELAEEFVEQVAIGGGVTVAVLAPLAVMLGGPYRGVRGQRSS